MKICAVLLAAGEGSRMGHIPKSLLMHNGESFLYRQLNSLRQAGTQSICVVTGYYFQQIEDALHEIMHNDGTDKTLIKILRNPAPDQGQQSSVELGLTSINPDCNAVIIALADQPLIDAKDMIELLTAFAQRPPGKEILYPVVKGQRGNPVLLSGVVLRAQQSQSGRMTCRDFIDTHPDLVERWHTDNDHYIIDVDTPQDLERLNKG